MSAPPRLYSGEWYSCDGHYDGEIRATAPDGHWPGMVLLELGGIGDDSFWGTLTVEDARDLAAEIGCAADSAEHAMKHARRVAAPTHQSDPGDECDCGGC